MPLINPAPLVYQTLSNQIDRMAKKDKTPTVSEKMTNGLLSRSSKKQSSSGENMSEISRVMHYMKYIRQQKEELKSNG
jgi:hypothetical protein